MATPNYGYEKRQRELAKKKKKEEKLRSKSAERRPDDRDPGQPDQNAGTDPAPDLSQPRGQTAP